MLEDLEPNIDELELENMQAAAKRHEEEILHRVKARRWPDDYENFRVSAIIRILDLQIRNNELETRIESLEALNRPIGD